MVVSSLEERNAYFLRNCHTIGYPDQLDFRWVKKGKTKASLTLARRPNLASRGCAGLTASQINSARVGSSTSR
jgi:hypothetical protein